MPIAHGSSLSAAIGTRSLPGQRVVDREHDVEVLLVQRLEVQARVGRAREERVLVGQHHVEAAERQRGHRGLGLGVGHLHAQRRVLARERAQRGREQVEAGGLDRGDPDGAGDQVRRGLQVGLGLLDVGEDHVGVVDESLRRGGQAQVAPDALEQRHAGLLLQLRELL